jgi:hypothetical protein
VWVRLTEPQTHPQDRCEWVGVDGVMWVWVGEGEGESEVQSISPTPSLIHPPIHPHPPTLKRDIGIADRRSLLK